MYAAITSTLFLNKKLKYFLFIVIKSRFCSKSSKVKDVIVYSRQVENPKHFCITNFFYQTNLEKCLRIFNKMLHEKDIL